MVNEDAFIEKPKLLSKQDLISNRNLFTEEERTILLNNPYVATVKNDAVQFTEEFKEIAYNEFVKNKKSMRKIFQENGIDIEILGAKHIRNFTAKLQEKAKKT